ncbi:hypothetical protein GCM10011519_19040 [Marmoricola endophyticus]|uniref:NAD-dependent epimerase/dehydratase domain-containing protein n=1 Tax=Marmoricola endophyticus TaxID=2040280 RepID=A0A917BIX1_9ACTN|nr:NAD-dependent epimerase/dehydratase family protein [Marmoricola endophyticus]GGF45341.1 hypothetical protein GCM10011519_19040 [Marmoricola endophyticus]
MGRVVLVTGVATDLGRRFSRRLVTRDDVDRVIGVDVRPPRGDDAGVHFVRADIRNPVIGKIIAREQVDTVVHMNVVASHSAGRSSMKELNVIGTMQLLAACQQSATVRHLVVKSSSTVYGASSRDPAIFTEDSEPRRLPRSGFGKDVNEVETYVRGFARRRPDVTVTMLRAANVIGPQVVSPITQYLRLPAIPTVVGFDGRLQFLHEQDVLGVLEHATTKPVHGTFNVAGDGVLLLSQVIRRLGRPPLPMPSFAVARVGQAARSARLGDFPPELVAFVKYGRVLDTTRCRDALGFSASYSTAEAVADFGASLRPGLLAAPRVARAEGSVRQLLTKGESGA